ncbi:S1 domain-containing RNA-binding protein [Aliibacillus thermotolerans]|uniref:S1 domain-containing RNA-binding protein n=1 Tax=Aliibacillus thermotolerans TaxID=1834418 RepID=A0ABW0U8E9_9BACI|nr:S1 domain-containing RNA-binding protein [Aliibacillus thermotolerans]MDA3128846.1 RNA-binding protein S1 [Aliibacillus thermotolerans]
MAIEVGSKLQGKVTGITNFGAFVELPDGKTGLVHISEIADKYVEDIHQFLTVGDEVTVKVLKVEDDGKIGLSIRRANEVEKRSRDRSKGGRRGGGKPQRELSFEEKMSRFMKDSEERLASLRKQTDARRGGRSRR